MNRPSEADRLDLLAEGIELRPSVTFEKKAILMGGLTPLDPDRKPLGEFHIIHLDDYQKFQVTVGEWGDIKTGVRGDIPSPMSPTATLAYLQGYKQITRSGNWVQRNTGLFAPRNIEMIVRAVNPYLTNKYKGKEYADLRRWAQQSVTINGSPLDSPLGQILEDGAVLDFGPAQTARGYSGFLYQFHAG